MKPKHIRIRAEQCNLIASASTCCRRQVGALIVDPESNVVLSEGYNGPPRGAEGALCGGAECLRDAGAVESGTQNDIGCHHAEANALMNAVRVGASAKGRWLFVSCDPCLMCAKLIHHAGIERVYAPLSSEAHTEGLSYLHMHGVSLYEIAES